MAGSSREVDSMGRRYDLRLVAAIVLAIAGTGRLARAQDEDAAGEGDGPQFLATFSITDEQFDQILFGTQKDGGTARRLLESRLRSRIEYIQSLYGLTPEERAKLDLAG